MTVQYFIRSSTAKVFFPLLMTAQLAACVDLGSGSNSGNANVSDSQVAPVSVTIAWTAPVAKADGSPLSLADIGGYRIYYGTSEGNFSNLVEINDATAVEANLSELPAGKYYFMVTIYDASGVESEFSPVVTKIIPEPGI